MLRRLRARRRHRPRARRWSCWLALALLAWRAGAPGAASGNDAAPEGPPPSPVVPGLVLQFPRDYGSHPEFGLEWWYLTGWLQTDTHEPLGFQITFFRSRQARSQWNPSAFAPRQLLIAHCAISDPARGRLWQDQRIRRAGLGLAEAQVGDTRVWIDDWSLVRGATGYRAHIAAQDFALDLALEITQPAMLNGSFGFSQKGPQPESASYYYSQPHLRVSGNIARAGHSDGVRGEAWLDHEWSSRYLDPQAVGWDWMGLNLADGGALMAFRIRDHSGQAYWAGATLRDTRGRVQTFGPDQVDFVPGAALALAAHRCQLPGDLATARRRPTARDRAATR